MKDKARRGIVGVEGDNIPKGGQILHGPYNTRHAVSAIPDEVCGEIRGEPSQPKVQQEPVVYLFLESTLGRKCGISGLPVPTPAQPS